MKNHTRKLNKAVSLAAASAITGLSLEALKAAKAAGCPAVKQSGRVDCDKLLAWLTEHPEVLEQAGDAVNRDLEITLKIRAERLLREHDLAVAREKFVPAEQVEKDTVAMISEAKTVLLAGPASLAPQVVGVPVAEAEQIIRRWLHDALARLSADPLGKRNGEPLKNG